MFSITAPRMDDKQVEHERDNMSEDEKMVIFRDLYGKEEPETALSPDEEDDLLAKLQEELDAIKVKDGYDLAAQRCNDILQDRDFRLQFLAAETNDVKVRERKTVERNFERTLHVPFYVFANQTTFL